MNWLKKVVKKETGQVLPVVLVVLLFGGLFVTPALVLTGTSSNINRIYEERTLGFYAADAGIESVCWELLQDPLPERWGTLPPPTVNWSLGQEINRMDTTLYWSEVGPATPSRGTLYTVKSTASLDGTDKGEIVAQIKLADAYSFLFDSAITTRGDLNLGSNSYVDGAVQINGTLNMSPGAVITGPVITWPITDWPTPEVTSAYYLAQVNTSNPYGSDTVTVTGLTSQTPLYRNGNLTIQGTGTGQLQGAIYCTGIITVTAGCTIDLNGFSIYSNYYNPSNPNDYAISLQPGCTLRKSGCIVAYGSINYQPDTSSQPDELVYVMSVAGKTWFKPHGDFYGCLAGDVQVDLQPNCGLYYIKFSGDWDFPTGEPKIQLVKYSITK